jgi:hypothetical protein
MKHRRLFIGSMVLIPVGIALLIVGNVISPLGMFGQTHGWWIFSSTTYETTGVYYLGLALTLGGLITIIGGTSGIVITIILEFLDREKTQPTT